MTGLLRRALLATTFIGLTLTGATAQEKLRAEVIHWWTSGGEAAAVKVFADKFNAAGGEWVDSAIAGGEASRSATINRIVGGNPPTAAQFNTGKQFQDLTNQGLLNSIEDTAEAGKWRDFMPPSFVEASTKDGKFYAVPINVHGQNWMFYSKDVFEKSGVAEAPKTFDELFAALDKIKAAGFIPLAQGGELWQERLLFNAVLLGVAGRDVYLKIYRDRDEAALQSPELLKAVETFGKLRQYADQGSAGRNWTDTAALVITGKAGIQIMGDWAKGDFKAAGQTPGQEFGCALTPGEQTFMIGGDVFVFPKTADPQQIKAQNLLATVMLDPETQVAFNTVKGSVPIRADIDTSSLDVCAKAGLEKLKSPDTQVGNSELLISSDLNGSVGDIITEYWNDPSASAEDMVAAYAEALQSID
jgi:glucose/mannose transport system substrate-binding protein